jgi:hypothetical protein
MDNIMASSPVRRPSPLFQGRNNCPVLSLDLVHYFGDDGRKVTLLGQDTHELSSSVNTGRGDDGPGLRQSCSMIEGRRAEIYVAD